MSVFIIFETSLLFQQYSFSYYYFVFNFIYPLFSPFFFLFLMLFILKTMNVINLLRNCSKMNFFNLLVKVLEIIFLNSCFIWKFIFVFMTDKIQETYHQGVILDIGLRVNKEFKNSS